MHQAQWSPERPLPPPVSLASQSHHEKPPEVTCTSRVNPGFPASTRESPRETFFNTSRGQDGHGGVFRVEVTGVDEVDAQLVSGAELVVLDVGGDEGITAQLCGLMPSGL